MSTDQVNINSDNDPKPETEEEPTIKRKKFPWKSFIKWILFGYIVGLSVTIACFLHFYTRVECLQSGKTFTFLILFLLYGFLLAGSRNVRCISTLVIPILCSSKGRTVVIASAFVLAATGPTVNIVRNVDILMESISCGQDQLKGALEKMLDLVKRPLVAVKDAVKIAMAEMKKILQKTEEILVRIRRTIADILNGIKGAFEWLGNVVGVCNKEMGTPFDRCIKVADKAMEDCKDYMGILSAMCNVTTIFRALCYSVKFIDAICVLVDFISDSIIGKVSEKLEMFTREMKTMFYVSVKFDHEFAFKTVATKNMTTVGSDVMKEIQHQTDEMFFLFGWIDFVGFFMSILVIIKAMLYKSKYLNNNRFDNYYINKYFIAINNQRKKMGKEVVLPLTRKESKRYVMLTSRTLVRAELMKMSRTVLFMLISTCQLLCICITDYSLYWLLSIILFYGDMESGLDVPPFITVNVSGGGFAADVVKGIVHAFEPMKENYEIDPRPCLPVPKIPEFRTYWKIGFLTFLAWVFLLMQPYGMRVRQVVMAAYYPDRARQRALWLYSEILLKRTSFIKLARRQARAKFLKDSSGDAYSFMDWLRMKTNRYWIFRKMFGAGKMDLCNICGTPLRGDDTAVKCQRVGCSGIYCAQCYAELDNICCLCNSPIDYGDLSDVSQEKDSSDEPLEKVEVKSEVTGESTDVIDETTEDYCSRFS